MTKFLSGIFLLLSHVGLWQPCHWAASWKAFIYKIFTVWNFIFFFIDMGSQIFDYFQLCENLSDYADNSFILLTMVGISIKMIYMIYNRRNIIELLKIIQSGSFIPRNQEEDKLRHEFENRMKWRTISFAIFMQMGTINLIISSIINLVPNRMTITKLYLPWNTKTSFMGFWMAFILQCISRWFDGLIIVACDGLVAGTMCRAAVQFEILQFRLKDLTSCTLVKQDKTDKGDVERLETETIAKLVREHLEIIRMVSKLNSIFGFVVFSQYWVSSIVLCVTVFVFSQVQVFDTRSAMLVTYIGCMYFQVYLLCSAGNEMTSQSSNLATYIYMCEWEDLTINTKKSLLLIMIRTCKPLKFTSWQLIELSIASFSQIVRFSYSAYNVLAQSQ
uniref:Odorant receptor n=1 Tax=Aulacocentrum confusum TaxID=2767324 RepID=A0A7G8Z957_9HYME|nr:olfactory receptor 38 [Aulacocentrum confusum]